MVKYVNHTPMDGNLEQENIDRDRILLEKLERHFKDEQKAYDARRTIHAFRRCLTPDGFEQYIENYFSKCEGYGENVKMRHEPGMDSSKDGGIDIYGFKSNDDGKLKHLFVQCKRLSGVRWGNSDQWDNKENCATVGANVISKLYGDVKKGMWGKKGIQEVVIATTTYLETKEALPTARKFGYRIIDGIALVTEIQNKYPLKEFIKDILVQPKEKWALFLDLKYTKAYYDCEKFLDEKQIILKETQGDLHELRLALKPYDPESSGIENPILESRRYLGFEKYTDYSKRKTPKSAALVEEAIPTMIESKIKTVTLSISKFKWTTVTVYLFGVLIGALMIILNEKLKEVFPGPKAPVQVSSLQSKTDELLVEKTPAIARKKNVQRVSKTPYENR